MQKGAQFVAQRAQKQTRGKAPLAAMAYWYWPVVATPLF
jgi:hypothetical protein